MIPPDRLPLVKRSLRLLIQELRPMDRVAIVVYAGVSGLVLESTPGSEKERILGAIERLEAGGSTAGGAGLRLAYQVAERSFIEEGNNRVILATDGDFNVGESSDAAMVRLIRERGRSGPRQRNSSWRSWTRRISWSFWSRWRADGGTPLGPRGSRDGCPLPQFRGVLP